MGKKNRTGVERQASAPTAGEKRWPAVSRGWVISILAAAVFFTFVNSLGNKFAYDDNTQILQNKFIRSLKNIPQAMVTEVWFWRVQQGQDPNSGKATTPYYRPVLTVYMMVSWALFGDSPAGWHLANLLLHLAVVMLVFKLLEKVTGDYRLAGLSALIFAVHPLRSESVAWVSGFSDLVLALFLLPSFIFYLKFRESGKKGELAASLGLFVLAAFSKEPAVALPIFIVAWEVLIEGQERSFRERLKPAITYSSMYLAICLFYFGMRVYALGFLFNDTKYAHYSKAESIFTIPLVVCKYIGLFVWPVNLSLFHGVEVIGTPLSLRFIIPLLILAAVAAALWGFRGSRNVRFAALWVGVNLLPVLNLGAFDANLMVQERYVYTASVGFSMLTALALMNLPVRQWVSQQGLAQARTAALLIAVLLLAGKSAAQNPVWKNDQALFNHGAEVADDQYLPHYILGLESIKYQNLDVAERELEKCIRFKGRDAFAFSNLAQLHIALYERTMDQSHIRRALEVAGEGLKENDSNAQLYDALGHACTYDGPLQNYQLALESYRKGLAITPDDAMLNYHLGATLAKTGDIGQGLPLIERARSLKPDFPDTYRALALVYTALNRVPEAMDSYNRLLQLQPNATDAQAIRARIEALRNRAQSGGQS